MVATIVQLLQEKYFTTPEMKYVDTYTISNYILLRMDF